MNTELTIYLTTGLFLFGLLIGSFLNVVAFRTLAGESIAFPPSHCPKCNHPLKPYDLVPLLSYLSVKGRCRYCKDRITPAYFFGELSTGILFAVSIWRFGWELETLVSLFLVSIMVVIVQTDIRSMLIPNKVILFAVLCGAVFRFYIHDHPLWDYAAGFFLGGFIILLIGWVGKIVFKKEAMGGGDVKLFAFIGLMIGIKLTLLSIFLASFVGVVFGIILIAAKVINRGNYMPFGPFIAVGSLLAYWWGDSLIQWYLSFILI